MPATVLAEHFGWEGSIFTRQGRQQFCSAACWQAAYRARHSDPVPPRHPDRNGTADTAYRGPDCDQRHLNSSAATTATPSAAAWERALTDHTAARPSPSPT